MPKNPFLQHEGYEPKLKRNSYDLSFQNNFTTKIGQITPVFCKPVFSGDSMSIDSAFALNFAPTVFPVQTPIRASLQYFYVRNRTIYKDWMDFQYNTKSGLTPPYLNISKLPKTGSLGDYLGLPTVFYNASTSTTQQPGTVYATRFAPVELFDRLFSSADNLIENNSEYQQNYGLIKCSTLFNIFSSYFNVSSYTINFETAGSDFISFVDDFIRDGSHFEVGVVLCHYYYDSLISSDHYIFDPRQDNVNYYVAPLSVSLDSNSTATGFYSINLPQSMVDYGNSIIDNGGTVGMFTYIIAKNYSGGNPTVDIPVNNNFSVSFTHSFKEGRSASTLHYSPNTQPINALPFRAYEAIYNAYFRSNEDVDPFTVSGTPEYNKYVPNLDGGADSYPYSLHFRNWEADMFTSARTSPQFGQAPLVGITSTGSLQIQREDGTIASIRTRTADDGNTIISVDNIDLSAEDLAVRQTAIAAATQGISINDFRNVNALQRFLENTIRRGMKYRDQVLAHTGVNVKYDELDMPEFLGGYSRMVNTSKVTDTAGVDNPLGSYAGQLSLFDGSKHSVTRYFDEAGFVIGLLTVVPQPIYSQYAPKYLFYNNYLDYYSPEFGKIGMQAIPNKEVAFLQALQGDALNGVFGYQRPWYDLISSVDEAHGEMRTSRRDYLMNRTFDGVPYLTPDFLHIDPEQVNDVFNYTDGGSDPVIGQIAFRCYKKTTIPRFGIPSLE